MVGSRYQYFQHTTQCNYFYGNSCESLYDKLAVFPDEYGNCGDRSTHCVFFLPFYRRLNVTTAYEYLEMRFNYAVRFIASGFYILLQLGRMGIILFLPAIALSTVTGINIYFCIAVWGCCVHFIQCSGESKLLSGQM